MEWLAPGLSGCYRGQWVALGKAGELNTGEWRANLCTDLVQVETAKMELLLPRPLQGGYRVVGGYGQGRRA